MSGNRIQSVYFRTPLKNGAGTLVLVEYADESMTVLLNDRPMEGCVWPSSELETAVAAFMQIQRRLEREHAPSAGG